MCYCCNGSTSAVIDTGKSEKDYSLNITITYFANNLGHQIINEHLISMNIWNTSLEYNNLSSIPNLTLDNGLPIFDWGLSDTLYTEKDLALPWEAQTGLILLYTLTIILSVVGNIVVLIVLTSSKRSRTDINIFLVNLAAADLCMACFCIPFTFTRTMLGRWIFGRVMCPLALFMQVLSVGVSIFTNTAIGIDRYYHIRLFNLDIHTTYSYLHNQTVIPKTSSTPIYLNLKWSYFVSSNNFHCHNIILTHYQKFMCDLCFSTLD